MENNQNSRFEQMEAAEEKQTRAQNIKRGIIWGIVIAGIIGAFIAIQFLVPSGVLPCH